MEQTHYTQVHLQFVFAPKYRESLIHESWENELYKYITGIVQANKDKLVAIDGMPQHVHMLIGFRPTQSMADLMQDVKDGSSKWINANNTAEVVLNGKRAMGSFLIQNRNCRM
jgi:REP element-mobilizing transposase RayT